MTQGSAQEAASRGKDLAELGGQGRSWQGEARHINNFDNYDNIHADDSDSDKSDGDGSDWDNDIDINFGSIDDITHSKNQSTWTGREWKGKVRRVERERERERERGRRNPEPSWPEPDPGPSRAARRGRIVAAARIPPHFTGPALGA